MKAAQKRTRIEWSKLTPDQRVIEMSAGHKREWTPKRRPPKVPCFLGCNHEFVIGDRLVGSDSAMPSPCTIAHKSCWNTRYRQLLAIEQGQKAITKSREQLKEQQKQNVIDAQDHFKQLATADQPTVEQTVETPQEAGQADTMITPPDQILNDQTDYRLEYEKLRSWKEAFLEGIAYAKDLLRPITS